MLKEFIDRIIELNRDPKIEIEGRTYTPGRLSPVKDPTPTGLHLNSLDGFINYIKVNIDQLSPNKLMIHVEGHDRISLVSPLTVPWKDRETYVYADLDNYEHGFIFGERYEPENFTIQLQASFFKTGSIEALLKLVGNMASGNIRTSNDDGVTQTVNTRAGVTLKGQAEIPNPIALVPYRTFREISQPASTYVFRVFKPRSDDHLPECALFEADGGEWKLAAMKSIKEYLEKEITTIPIIA